MNTRSPERTRKMEVLQASGTGVQFQLSAVSSRKFLYTKGDDGLSFHYFYADLEAGWYVILLQQHGEYVLLERGTVDDEMRGRLQRKNPAENPIQRFLDAALSEDAARWEPDSDRKRVRYGSVWEMAMFLPPELRDSLDQILGEFSPELSAERLCRQFTTLLVRLAKENRSVRQDKDQVNRWIEELGSETFAVRQAAERKLLEGARRSVLLLDKLDTQKLDPEQQLRMRRILERVGQPDDTMVTEAFVAGFVEDVKVWAKVLESPEGEERQLAIAKLRELTQTAWEFDPMADEASRKKALALMRGRPEWKERVSNE